MNSDFYPLTDINELRYKFTARLAYLIGRQNALIKILSSDDSKFYDYDFFMTQLSSVSNDIDILLSDFNRSFHDIYYGDL